MVDNVEFFCRITEPNNKRSAKRKLCKKDVGLSSTGIWALRSHSKVKNIVKVKVLKASKRVTFFERNTNITLNKTSDLIAM